MVTTRSIQLGIETLREIKLFQAFTDAELSHLIEVGSIGVFEPHSNIVIEGELSGGLYLILEGLVGIFKSNKLSGDAYDVGQLREGSFFGEMSLVDENPRSATVRALTDCKLFFLSKETFIGFLGQSQALKLRFYENCVNELIVRLRHLDDNYVISQYQLWKNAIKKEAS